MNKKQQRYIIKGMNRDTSISKGNTEYSHTNYNIRIDVNHEENLFTISNEKSTEDVIQIRGIVLGYCVVEDKCVIFTKDGNTDRIELFHNNTLKTLAEGNMNFNVNNPIETIPLVETSNIKRVYWIDGINVLRSININTFKQTDTTDVSTVFDSISHLGFNESFNITKVYDNEGEFPSGTIQFFFNYTNTNGKESPIVSISPIHYLTEKDKSISPDSKTTQSFNISISNIDTSFDNIVIYSVIQTSLKGDYIASKTSPIPIKGRNSIEYKHTNKNIISIDPTIIYFLGSDYIVPNTFTSKSNTLFLGNYEFKREHILEYNASPNITVKDKVLNGNKVTLNTQENKRFTQYYTLNNNEEELKYFKPGDTYALGIVLQHYTGKFSSPIYIGNYTIPYNDTIKSEDFTPNMLSLEIDSIISSYKDKGYIKAIPLVYSPKINNTMYQGVLNPTMYNVGDRQNHSPDSHSSWFFRPNPPLGKESIGIQYRHNKPLPTSDNEYSEIINNYKDDFEDIDYTDYNSWNPRKNRFIVDRELVSLYSPNVNESSPELVSSDYKLHIIGTIPIHSSIKDLSITTSKAPKNGRGGENTEYKNMFRETELKNKNSYTTLSASPSWKEEYNGVERYFMVYPFHNNGGIGHNKTGEEATSVIDSKVLYNYRYSRSNLNKDITSIELQDIVVIGKDENKLYEYKKGDNSLIYKNYIDKILYGGGVFNNDTLNYYNVSVSTMINSTWSIMHYNGNNHYAPVPITFKNSPHILLSLSSILPYTDYKTNIDDVGTSVDPIETDTKGKFKLENFVDMLGKTSFNVYVEKKDVRSVNDILDNIEEIKKEYKVLADSKNLESELESININPYALPNTYGYFFNISRNKDKLMSPEQFTALGINICSILDRYIGSEEKEFGLYRDEVEVVNAEEITYDNVLLPKNNILLSMSVLYHTDRLEDVKRVYKDYHTYTTSKSHFFYIKDSTYEKIGNSVSHNFKLFIYSKGKEEFDPVSEFKSIFKVRKTKTKIDIDKIQEPLVNNEELIKDYGYMLLGELRRNTPITINKEDIVWRIAGRGNLLTDNSIDYTIGDTMYQRFNCVGTMPLEGSKTNQIIDILSFMVETKENIDSIYSNRNFFDKVTEYVQEQKSNDAYLNDNNFFKFRELDKTQYNSIFKNSVTLTHQKFLGEPIDTWQHITGIANQDLDGTKEEITKLITHKDTIIGFQKNGIAQILYNERVQIPTSDNVPIEIANGTKLQGYRYISENVGCQNKWSVCSHRNGIIFNDDNSDIMYQLSEGISPISEQLGFRTYMQDRLNKDTYTPINKGTITFYDDYRGDVYIINDKCLSYSLKLGTYESFFNYENTKAMFNLNNELYTIANGRIWKHNSNSSYNYIHGNTYPFSIKYKINPEGFNDKIFTNIEMRADSFINTDIKNVVDIDTIEVKNEYQFGKSKLRYNKYTSSNIKKKFRVWRADIPRQENTMNRIRNTWCYLTLTSKETNDKTNIHDLTITYYE